MTRIYSNLIYPLLNHPLNKGAKGKAILRFLLWQIKLRWNSPKEIVVPFIGGSKFFVKKGRTGITGNLYTGLHEFYEMMFLLHFLRKEDVFFDVGANVGSYSILSSGTIGAATYSFEPVPATFSLLSSNRAINNNSTWTLINSGIGDVEDELIFSIDMGTMNGVVAEDYKGQKLKIKVNTLDQYCTANSVIPILLKIDAEDFDSNVILGASKILKDTGLKAIIVESVNEKAITLLKENGFEQCDYNPFSRELSKSDNKRGNNNLFIRDKEFIDQRLTIAPKVKVLSYYI